MFGHADFFRHNVWYAPTDRKMLDRMADHGTRLRAFIDDLGQDRVEVFLDRALSIESLVDPFLPLANHLRQRRPGDAGRAAAPHARPSLDDVLDASELVDFADCHSGATAAVPGQLNPYKLGIDLYRAAEQKGMDLFRLRRIHNDASFVDELVDEEFASKSELFVYGRNGRTGRTEVLERSFKEVKEKLLQELAWGGLPQIELAEDDFEGKGELHLVHRHDGRDLELASAGETLKGIAEVWGRPAHLSTQEEGQGRRLTSDGKQVKVSELPAPTPAKAEAE